MRRKRHVLASVSGNADLVGTEHTVPVLEGGTAFLRRRDRLLVIAVRGVAPGWWRIRLDTWLGATVIHPAEPWERDERLATYPALRLVLLGPMGNDAWQALPYHPIDLVRHPDLPLPLTVQLVEQGQCFEGIIGRIDGMTIWYEGQDRQAEPTIAEDLRAALGDLQVQPSQAVAPGEMVAYILALAERQALLGGKGRQRGHAEHIRALLALAELQDWEVLRQALEAETALEAWQGRSSRRGHDLDAMLQAIQVELSLRHSLALAGAQLVGYNHVPAGLQVSWERGRVRSTTLVEPTLDVQRAGICLSGRDRDYDLASIVSVVCRTAEVPLVPPV